MSVWSKMTQPFNKALDSNAFKAVFPVYALAQKAVSMGSGLTGLNHGKGLRPMDQYGIGAGVGSLLGGGGALMGSGASGAGGGAGGVGGAGGAGGPMQSGATPISRYLQMARSGAQPQQQQAMQQPPTNTLDKIYQMFPHLRPQVGGLRNGIQ